MISRDQIRAARALLDWSQPKLAELASVSTDLVSKIENGITDGSLKTLNRIQIVLEHAGLEFIEHDGVKRRQEGITTYEGVEGFTAFSNDIYETVKKHGGQIVLCNADDAQFMKWAHFTNMAEIHMERMAKLKEEIDYNFFILVQEESHEISGSHYAEYRCFKETKLGTIPFYCYGNKLAMIIWGDSLKIYVFHHKEIADAYRLQFNEIWKGAQAVHGKEKR